MAVKQPEPPLIVEKPVPLDLIKWVNIEMEVHQKDDKDYSHLGRANEIEAEINRIVGFDFCGATSISVQDCSSEETESVTFVTPIKREDIKLLAERLKKNLKINVWCKPEA